MNKRFQNLNLPILCATLCALTLDGSAANLPHMTDDAWDTAQGAKVTSHSELWKKQAPSDLFGTGLSHYEGGTLIFADEGKDGTIHFVEWQTPKVVTIRAFGLHAAHDPGAPYRRSIRKFRLLGFDKDEGEFIELYSNEIALPYSATQRPNFLNLCGTLGSPFVGNRFRAEFVKHGDEVQSGPRINELDGFAVAPDDLIDDEWQSRYFGTDFIHNPDAGADADPDGDSVSNLLEFRNGTIPTIAEGWYGITSNDLWDASAGTQILGHSGLVDVRHALGMFGASNASDEKSDATVFGDGQTDGFVHYIEWATPAKVTVKAFNIHAQHDSGPGYLRAFREVRFYTRDAAAGVFNLIETRSLPAPTAMPYPGSTKNTIELPIVLDEPVTNNQFRIEFVQSGGAAHNGPRILEIDAFAIPPVDSIDDTWQSEYFGITFLTNPLAAPDQDPDGDNSTNEEEYVLGTNPNDPLSGFAANRMAPVISWNSKQGATYRVKRADADDPSNYVIVAEAFQATESVSTFVDITASDAKGFYVIEAIPTP